MVERGEAAWATLAAAEREEMEEVVAMLTEAAAQGHMMAQVHLGNIYDFGMGVAQDEVRAFELYIQAAQQGHARSQFNLGIMYRGGVGDAGSGGAGGDGGGGGNAGGGGGAGAHGGAGLPGGDLQLWPWGGAG